MKYLSPYLNKIIKQIRPTIGLIKTPQLKPNSDLTIDSSLSYDWVSSGKNAEFTLFTRKWLPGWYMLELCVDHNQPSATSSIKFFSVGPA